MVERDPRYVAEDKQEDYWATQKGNHVAGVDGEFPVAVEEAEELCSEPTCRAVLVTGSGMCRSCELKVRKAEDEARRGWELGEES